MHRFYVPKRDSTEPVLSAAQAQQIARVLRLRAGERIEVFDGEGAVAELELTRVGQCEVTGEVGPETARLVAWPLPWRPIRCLSLIRPQRFAWAVEQAAELGAWQIVALHTARVAHAGREVSEPRVDRWQQIAIEASEQCGSAFAPRVLGPSSLDQAVQRPAALRLCA